MKRYLMHGAFAFAVTGAVLALATDSFAVAVSIALGTVFVAALSRMV